MKTLIAFLAILFLFSNESKAGFNWISDWNVTSFDGTKTEKINVPETNNVEIFGNAVLEIDSYSFVHSKAFRQFELSGYSEPVQVSIQTVLKGFSNINNFGLRTTSIVENGIDFDLQNYQRSFVMPGSSEFTMNRTRTIQLTNGIYNFQAEFDPIISPNLQLYSASIYGSAYMNIQIIPEPSSVVLLILGIVFIKKL